MKYVAGLLLLITLGILLAVVYSYTFINFKGYTRGSDVTQEDSIKNAETRIKEIENRILKATKNIDLNDTNNKSNYILTNKDRQEEILIMLKRLYIILEETKNSNLDIDLDNLTTINNEINKYNKNIKNNNTKTETNAINKDYNIVFPSELLIKFSPEIYPTKIENDGFFGLYLFTKIKYSTYLDSNNNIKFYIFDAKYKDIKKNLELVDKLYTINENNEFFDKSFFLNKIKKDNIVRIVISVDNKTVGVELNKDKYIFFKKIIKEND